MNGAVLEAAVKAVKGNVEDKPALMAALRATNVDTVRGPVKFDELGNVVGNVYLRKVTRKDGRLVNSVFKTYPNVSQFWTYGKEAFLANPVYSRDIRPQSIWSHEVLNVRRTSFSSRPAGLRPAGQAFQDVPMRRFGSKALFTMLELNKQGKAVLIGIEPS